jgi:hypothetical protein
VTDDEIKVLMEQGAEAGVFHESEQEIVSNVLRLDEQRISAIMTPRRRHVRHRPGRGRGDPLAARREPAIPGVVVCRDGLEHVARRAADRRSAEEALLAGVTAGGSRPCCVRRCTCRDA